MSKAQGRFDIKVDEPNWIEVPKGSDRDPKGYNECINKDLDPNTQIVVVIIDKKDFKKFIKANLDRLGVPS